MAFASYSLTCANYGDNEKCRWICGFKGYDPQPECYKNKFLAALEGGPSKENEEESVNV